MMIDIDTAIKKGAKAIWMQEGIVNKEASQKAQKAGIKVIMDRCMYKKISHRISKGG